MEEQKKLIIYRVSWFIILILAILIPLIINVAQPKLDMVDDHGYIDYYYTSLDETSVRMDIEFNRDVNSGYVIIRFYDNLNRFLEEKKVYFNGYRDTTLQSFVNVKGEVDSYEIVSYEFDTPSVVNWNFSLFLPLYAILITFFILSLMLCYKEYYYNGNKISVYAGWYHHTLKVNGVKCDEHNTITSYVPIKLSTTLDDGTIIDVTISLSNRITIKANDRLI